MHQMSLEKRFNSVSVQTEALKKPPPKVEIREVVRPDPEMEAQLAANQQRIKELEMLINEKNAEI